jgi:hypothetical protein
LAQQDGVKAQENRRSASLEAPQRLRRIRLLFREEKEARTQEFVLRWSPTQTVYRAISCASSHFSSIGSD